MFETTVSHKPFHLVCILYSMWCCQYRRLGEYKVLELAQLSLVIIPSHSFLANLPSDSHFISFYQPSSMKFTQTLLPVFLSGAALAAPSATLDKRATTVCGEWDSVVTGTYTVYQDLWDEDAASSGSQCTTVTSDSDSLAWSTSWSWEGASSSVKSFANAVVTQDAQQISAISSIPSTWDWS